MTCRMVRFYYGEHTDEGFHEVAFDDYDEDLADEHEEELKAQSLEYLRVEL